MTQNGTLLKVGLVLGGLAGVGLLLKHYASQHKQEQGLCVQPSTLSIEKTRQLMQQIKYQMLVVCIKYAEKMSSDMLRLIPPQQKELAKEKLREAMIANYENKEKVILDKHVVLKDDYTSALLAYEADPFLAQNRQQIFLMMERAINGQYPNLEVPSAALTVNSLDRMAEINQELCLMIGKAVWRKMYDCSQNDSAFDPNNDDHFKRAIREIQIYQMKVEYLQAKGYLRQWGCPNEVFLKATEAQNLRDPAFKLKIRSIDKAYNKLIDLVSTNPLSLVQQDIESIFVNEINTVLQEEASKTQKQSILQMNNQSQRSQAAKQPLQAGTAVQQETALQ